MRKKTELYKKEQENIIKNIIDILDLDDNNSCLLYEVEQNEDKIEQLMKLIPTIRKFFSFSKIRGVSEPRTTKRPWLSMVRQITKYKYNMYACDVKIDIKENGETKKIRTQKYFFTLISN